MSIIAWLIIVSILPLCGPHFTTETGSRLPFWIDSIPAACTMEDIQALYGDENAKTIPVDLDAGLFGAGSVQGTMKVDGVGAVDYDASFMNDDLYEASQSSPQDYLYAVDYTSEESAIEDFEVYVVFNMNESCGNGLVLDGTTPAKDDFDSTQLEGWLEYEKYLYQDVFVGAEVDYIAGWEIDGRGIATLVKYRAGDENDEGVMQKIKFTYYHRWGLDD